MARISLRDWKIMVLSTLLQLGATGAISVTSRRLVSSDYRDFAVIMVLVAGTLSWPLVLMLVLHWRSRPNTSHLTSEPMESVRDIVGDAMREAVWLRTVLENRRLADFQANKLRVLKWSKSIRRRLAMAAPAMALAWGEDDDALAVLSVPPWTSHDKLLSEVGRRVVILKHLGGDDADYVTVHDAAMAARDAEAKRKSELEEVGRRKQALLKEIERRIQAAKPQRTGLASLIIEPNPPDPNDEVIKYAQDEAVRLGLDGVPDWRDGTSTERLGAFRYWLRN